MTHTQGFRHVIRIADWAESPGARYRSDGPYSGEEFREKHLAPAFTYALNDDAILLVDLDGTYGYSSGFLEEVFGGLARTFGSDRVHETLQYKTEDEPSLEDEIRGYIAEATNLSGKDGSS